MIITKTIVGKNEFKRYLPKMLEETSNWADLMIFLGDDTDKETIKLIKKYPKAKFFASGHDGSLFNVNEALLRTKLWEHVRKHAKENDWVVSLDTDEVIKKEEILKSIKAATENKCERITFRLIDLWSKSGDDLFYRVDGYWSPRITRAYKYKNENFGVDGAIHCGCVPSYAWKLKDLLDLESRLVHYGWLSDDDKLRKSEFYLEKTNQGTMNFEHALTVMYRRPTVFKLEESNFVDRHKILIATLVKNRDWILPEYLEAIEKQSETYNKDNISWYFIVNDNEDNSLDILKKFKASYDEKYSGRIEIEVINFKNVDAKDHHWNAQKLFNMAFMRNKVAGFMMEKKLDAIFMVDTDIILQSNDTLRHMVSLERDVVSQVFWAVWGQQNNRALPNVWINGGYHVTETFIEQLKTPGTYEVGGLGACTVYFKDCFERGCTFDRVKFLPREINGEDRDFCCRASVLGVKLYADTCKTPLHLEKNEVIERDYLKKQNLGGFKFLLHPTE